jgi:hypothetical protein
MQKEETRARRKRGRRGGVWEEVCSVLRVNGDACIILQQVKVTNFQRLLKINHTFF